MKFKINMDYINKNFIKKIGRDKLILICGAVAVLIICLIWEEKNDKASDKQYADSGVLNNENDSRDKFGIYMEKYVREQEEKLKSILSRIDGVGEVYVMITVKTGASKDILMEQDISYEDTD